MLTVITEKPEFFIKLKQLNNGYFTIIVLQGLKDVSDNISFTDFE